MLIEESPMIALSNQPITVNKVGSWRFVEPFLEIKTAPCQSECPIGQNAREIMALLESGNEEKAFFQMANKNPFLYTTGTVCPHFCEQGCNRGYIDSSIHISKVEQYLGEKFLSNNLNSLKKEQNISKKVAVIGAGPAGLSIAFHLARHGVEIDVFEREREAGGIVRFGIPDLRLKKEIFKKEIERLLKSFPNIHIHLNQEILPSEISELESKYDKIFLAAGLQASVSSELSGVHYGIDTLKSFHQKKYSFPANGHYLVLGGGNTAMDVAFYLLKHKNRVSVLVRKEKQQMRAFADEIQMVEKMGAKILDCSQLENWNHDTHEANLNLSGEKTTWQPDGVFVCFGQKPEEMWRHVKESEKLIKIGDISGKHDATLVHAIASGRKSALEFLFPENALDLTPVHSVVTHKQINLDFWKEHAELRKENPIDEAARCIQCGECTACGVCETFCPDFAIDTKDKAEFNYDYCKGCEICSIECPRGAVSVKEV